MSSEWIIVHRNWMPRTKKNRVNVGEEGAGGEESVLSFLGGRHLTLGSCACLSAYGSLLKLGTRNAQLFFSTFPL